MSQLKKDFLSSKTEGFSNKIICIVLVIAITLLLIIIVNYKEDRRYGIGHVVSSENQSLEEDINEQHVILNGQTYLKMFQNHYSEYNDFALELYQGIQNNQSSFTHSFNSKEEAERFVLEFNESVFKNEVLPAEIELTSFENSTATIDVYDTTFKSITAWNDYVNLVNSLISEDASMVFAIQMFNQWLVENVSYDNYFETDNTPLSVIYSFKSQTEGITKAFKIMCDIAGIGCSIQMGTKDGTPHSWNKVYIGKNTYYIDVSSNVLLKNANSYYLSDQLWGGYTVKE